MDKNIKVSIVIPIYNMQLYLRNCLDSVLSQTLQEIEVICVNDGSTDESSQILDTYACNKKIIIINQKNKGSGPARNRGMMMAKGKYVAFVDPDDYYAADDVLETLYLSAEKEDVMIYRGNMRDSQGNYYRGMRFLENKRMTFAEIQEYWSHCSAIYNLKFLKQNKIYYPDYRRFQDPPFIAKAMIKAKEFFAVNKDVYIYRIGYKINDITETVVINIVNGIRDIFEVIYDDENHFVELGTRIYQENREVIMRYSCDRMDSAALKKALDEMNVMICKVLGENYILTEEKIAEYRCQCTSISRAITNKEPIIIYGAGIVGQRVINQVHSEGGDILGIAVSEMQDNFHSIEGIPVKAIEKYIQYADEAYVIIATSGKLWEEIKRRLAQYHFQKVIALTGGQWNYVSELLKRQDG